MADWFTREFVATGKLPLLLFFTGMLGGFGFIRLSVRLIRAQVRWWPGNVTPGGMHIHHVVFGVVFMLVGGVAGLAVAMDELGWRAGFAALFGIGSALVLDEFALILHLRDVYWSEEGRLSVDAVFVAIALTGLLLLGFRPGIVNDVLEIEAEGGSKILVSAVILADLLLAVVTVLKGKIWSGLLGVFLPPLLIVGALRLARPRSPWARWRYQPETSGGARKLAKARWRERKLRYPVVRAKIRLQELIAGRPDR